MGSAVACDGIGCLSLSIPVTPHRRCWRRVAGMRSVLPVPSALVCWCIRRTGDGQGARRRGARPVLA